MKLFLAALVVAAPLAAQTVNLSVGIPLLPPALSPRQSVLLFADIRNLSTTPATNVRIEATMPLGGSIDDFVVTAGGGVTCAIADNTLRCTAPQITNTRPVQIGIRITAPDNADGASFSVFLQATANEPDADAIDNRRTTFLRMKRELRVTNTNDSGAGSLRQAILDANVLCPRRNPCNIGFRIPAEEASNGKMIIQPRTPLPVLTGAIAVDGGTQTAVVGDTNPDGPEIEINGALQPDGEGLRLSPNCTGEVYDLIVSGFRGHGLEVSRMPGDPAPNPCFDNGPTIRVTIARNHLIGNMRGLALRSYFTTIEDNVIRGNARSGLFAGDGHFAFIRNNRIEANGASGIYLDLENGADVWDNRIANNAHWGLARTARGNVDVNGTSFSGNLHQPIDIGLDGDTPMARPVLFWAIYDTTRNVTVVEGRLDSDGPPRARYFVELYASQGLSPLNYPQAERPLLERELRSGHTDFRIEIAEDLRGQWVTAAATVQFANSFARTPRAESHQSQLPGNTSEVSNAVFVAP